LPGRLEGRRLAHYLGRHTPSEPQWAAPARFRLAKTYSLPNGRRYALLEARP